MGCRRFPFLYLPLSIPIPATMQRASRRTVPPCLRPSCTCHDLRSSSPTILRSSRPATTCVLLVTSFCVASPISSRICHDLRSSRRTIPRLAHPRSSVAPFCASPRHRFPLLPQPTLSRCAIPPRLAHPVPAATQRSSHSTIPPQLAHPAPATTCVLPAPCLRCTILRLVAVVFHSYTCRFPFLYLPQPSVLPVAPFRLFFAHLVPATICVLPLPPFCV